MLLRLPGVYRADHDSALLADVLRERDRVRYCHVLDMGTGTGVLALAAAQAGAASVTAVDLSRRSAVSAWLNARLSGAPITVLCGDLFEPVRGKRFDVVVANPPYIPGSRRKPVRHGIARSWDAGYDGRLLLDRIIRGLPDVLAPDGRVLIVQSKMCGVRATLDAMAELRMDAEIVGRATIPFGPVVRTRAAQLQRRGLLAVGQTKEHVVVVEGKRALPRRAARPSRVDVTGEGPVLVHGPVDVVAPDGRIVRSERGVTALCTCKRSRRLPFCDTSHRDRTTPRAEETS